jgi:hypothetical protein
MTELETLRARVAELEDAIRAIIHADERGQGTPFAEAMSYAASLLSAPPDAERTPEQRAALDQLLRDDGELYDDTDPDVVERVARAIWERQGYCKDDLDDPFQRLSWKELKEIEADYAPTVAHTMDLARAAIAAMLSAHEDGK